MNIKFDNNSIEKWKEKGISSVWVHFVEKGCEGTKVEVSEKFNPEGLESDTDSTGNLQVWYRPTDKERLDSSVITNAKGKWIFTSHSVARRCGCGSSFAFSGIPNPGTQNGKVFTLAPIHGTLDSHVISDGYYFSRAVSGRFIQKSGTSTWYIFIDSTSISAQSSSLDIVLSLPEENSHMSVRILLVAKECDISLKFTGVIASKNSSLDIRALSLVSSGGTAKLHLTGDVQSGSNSYDLQVHQSTVFLDSTGSVAGIPGLRVACDDGVAEHSATFHTLDTEGNEYLLSRGLSKKTAKKLLLGAKVSNIFPEFSEEYRSMIIQSL